MMNEKKNFLYNLSYTILNLILPLITAPYISRIVGPHGVGMYSYYYSIASYFVIFGKLGLINYGTRLVSKVRDDRNDLNKTFSSIYYQQIIAGIITILIYIAYAIFISNDKLLSIIMITLVASILFDIDWLYSGLEQFKVIALKNFVIKIITVLCIFLFVKNKNDLWLYALILCLGNTLGFISMWFGVKKSVRFVKVEWRDITNHFRPNLILLVPVIAVNIYRTLDKIIVGYISGMVQTGYYENAEKIIYALCGIITSFGTVMMPKISNLIANGKKNESQKYLINSMNFIMFITCGISFGVVAISEKLTVVVFGIDFIMSAELLRALALTIIFIGWANVIRTQYIMPNNLDNLYIKSVVIGAIVNFTINILLIPQINAYGAVIGTFIAEFIAALLQTIQVRKKIPIKKMLKDTSTYIIAAIVMYIILCLINYKLDNNLLSIIIMTIIGLFVYVISIFIILVYKKSDYIKYFKEKFKNK